VVETTAGLEAGDPVEEALVARLREAGCVWAEDEARLLLAAAHGPALDALAARRAAGEPLEQVLGWAAFAGLRLVVEPGVFVPRRRTELLVRLADAALTCPDAGRGPDKAPVVVELCCGVGAVAAALLELRPALEVVAADLDPAAVRCARRNLGGRAEVVGGDLFAELPGRLRGRVDVLVANAPYVPTAAIATMPPEARLHESVLALDGGGDGLDLHRRIAAGAGEWLSAAGTVLVETSRAQAEATAALFTTAGLVAAAVRDDDLDATVVRAARPAG
jgi:release factor glutamine methyltransferase